MKIETDRLLLRPFRLKDKEECVSELSDLETNRYLSRVPFPYTSKHAIDFINKFKKMKSDSDKQAFAIQLKENTQLIGVVSLSHIDYFNKSANIGYWISKQHRRKGYVFEAVCGVLDFAFEKLQLNRIGINMFVHNTPSIKLAEKVGATKEGLRKEYWFDKKTKAFRDVFEYGLLVSQWKKH